jgi:hypothetical protein
MDQAELIPNMEVTAEKLCGQAVRVRVRKPNGSNGCARKDLHGNIVIDLDPALLDERHIKNFALVFAHEAAHVKLHHREMVRTNLDAPPSIKDERQLTTIVAMAAKVNPEVRRREAEANAQTAQWMKVVNRFYPFYSTGDADPFITVLRILYHYADR